MPYLSGECVGFYDSIVALALEVFQRYGITLDVSFNETWRAANSPKGEKRRHRPSHRCPLGVGLRTKEEGGGGRDAAQWPYYDSGNGLELRGVGLRSSGDTIVCILVIVACIKVRPTRHTWIAPPSVPMPVTSRLVLLLASCCSWDERCLSAGLFAFCSGTRREDG